MAEWVTEILPGLPLGAGIVLLPGFVVVGVMSKFRAQRREDIARQSFQYLIGSLVCFCLTSFFFWDRLLALTSLSDVTRWDIALAFGVLFGNAVLVGCAVGLWTQWDIGSQLLTKVGIRSVRSSVSAWDSAFERDSGCLVRLELEGGEVVFAVFGTKSNVAAGPDRDSRDCYFEETYIENDVGELVPQVGSQGIWIHASLIKSIRFFDTQGLATHEARTQCMPSSTGEFPKVEPSFDLRDEGVRPNRNQRAHANAVTAASNTSHRQS